MSSTKGATGHLLGAAGSLEAIFAIQALYERRLPATLNLEHPCRELDPVFRDHLVRGPEPSYLPDDRPYAVMSNSFGFGGANISLVFAPAPLWLTPTTPRDEDAPSPEESSPKRPNGSRRDSNRRRDGLKVIRSDKT